MGKHDTPSSIFPHRHIHARQKLDYFQEATPLAPTKKDPEAFFHLEWSSFILLTPGNVERQLPNVPGVYQMVCVARDQFYSLLVGRSQGNSLRESVRHELANSETHLLLNRLTAKGRVYLRYAPCPREHLDLLDLEWFLNQRYRPVANEKLPVHSGRFEAIHANCQNGLPPVTRITA